MTPREDDVPGAGSHPAPGLLAAKDAAAKRDLFGVRAGRRRQLHARVRVHAFGGCGEGRRADRSLGFRRRLDLGGPIALIRDLPDAAGLIVGFHDSALVAGALLERRRAYLLRLGIAATLRLIDQETEQLIVESPC